MRKLYDLEKEKICWKPWMISGVGIWTGLVAMGLLLFAVACSEGTGGGQSSEDLILFSWEGQIALLSALDFACGSIFAAALASRVVVRDYGKDYASVLLLYPMNRKRMFRAKELLISLRTVLLCLPALLIATGILAFVAAVARVRLFNTVSLVLDQCPGSRTSCRIDGVSSWYDFRLCRMETEIPNGQYCLRDSDCMSGVKRDCHHAKVSDSGSDGNGSFFSLFAPPPTRWLPGALPDSSPWGP